MTCNSTQYPLLHFLFFLVNQKDLILLCPRIWRGARIILLYPMHLYLKSTSHFKILLAHEYIILEATVECF